MKEIWFIRHGESEANAGIATTDPGAILLTERGHQQAVELANRLEVKPDLFIMTPYIRTQLTAVPALNKFPMVPVEIWPLQEYNFLSPAQCVKTTVTDRKPWVAEFWSKCDPFYIHGDGAESFLAFSGRVVTCVKLLERRKEKFIIVFAHGQVIRAIWQYLATGKEQLQMDIFRDKMLDLIVPNAGIFKCRHRQELWQIVDPLL